MNYERKTSNQEITQYKDLDVGEVFHFGDPERILMKTDECVPEDATCNQGDVWAVRLSGLVGEQNSFKDAQQVTVVKVKVVEL